MNEQTAEYDAVLGVLTEHVGSAGEFCRGCHITPSHEELDDWDTVGIKRHQADQILAALTRVIPPAKGSDYREEWMP